LLGRLRLEIAIFVCHHRFLLRCLSLSFLMPLLVYITMISGKTFTELIIM